MIENVCFTEVIKVQNVKKTVIKRGSLDVKLVFFVKKANSKQF